MGLSEKIRMAMAKRNLNGVDLAKALDCSNQNVYALLKKDNWSEKQLRKLENILDVDFRIKVVFRDTKEEI